MSRVYVVNKSGHDFSPADQWGDVAYLSEGAMVPYGISNMFRQFSAILSGSSPDDYIVPTGLTNMSIVACCLFVTIHGRLNLLLLRDGRYISRSLVFKDTVHEAESVLQFAKEEENE